MRLWSVFSWLFPRLGGGRAIAYGKVPSPTPPHKGEGLNLPPRSRLQTAGAAGSLPPCGGDGRQARGGLYSICDRVPGVSRITASNARFEAVATSSLFSPAGRSAKRMRGDEGATAKPARAAHCKGGLRPLSSGLSGHLVPGREKREFIASPLRIIALLFLWLFALVTHALAADPIARATLQSKDKLYVGQQVLIDVSVLVPNYFLQPPQFPIFDLPGTIVSLQDGQALNLNETIDGIAYSGIQRTYILVPQKDGDFTLPPAEITFGYAAEPGQTTQGKASLPPFKFTVEAAPGGNGTADNTPGVVAAKVTVTQDISPDPKTLKAGDTLVRTIIVRAEGLRAMMIPTPDFAAPNGVRAYGQDPVLSEETDARGQPLAGVRKDVEQYLFSDAGQYDLPAVEISWFDPASARTESVSAPAVHVSVAESPAAAADTGLAPPPTPEPEAKPFNWFRVGLVGGSAIVAGAIIWLLARALSWLQHALEKTLSDRRQSEAAYFRHVEQACHDGAPGGIDKALDNWSRMAGILPLRPWLVRFGTDEALTAFDDHRRAIYGDEKVHSHSSEHLLHGLNMARASWLKGEQPHQTRWHGVPLPGLNPDWDRA